MKHNLYKVTKKYLRLFFISLFFLCRNLCDAKVTMNAHYFYDLKETAKELGLKLKWTKSQEEVILSDNDTQLIFHKEKRYVVLNNTHIWLKESVRQRGFKLLICKNDVESILLPIVKPQRFAENCPKLYRIVS